MSPANLTMLGADLSTGQRALDLDAKYYDSWADPGKQTKPAAWSTHGINQPQTDVYDHTHDMCDSLTTVQNTARNTGATGTFYWQPTWHATPGNGRNPTDINNSGNEWDNMTIFDRNGRLNPGIRWTP